MARCGVQYWSCFYWAATTLVKVPWVAPMTWIEQFFTSFIIIIGTFTFSVIIGQVRSPPTAPDGRPPARLDRLLTSPQRSRAHAPPSSPACPRHPAHFGSARAVSAAGLEDLEAVEGISKKFAQQIYDWFYSGQS